jgi:hypothetical protein
MFPAPEESAHQINDEQTRPRGDLNWILSVGSVRPSIDRGTVMFVDDPERRPNRHLQGDVPR